VGGIPVTMKYMENATIPDGQVCAVRVVKNTTNAIVIFLGPVEKLTMDHVRSANQAHLSPATLARITETCSAQAKLETNH
jgi:hypothetical protein